MSEVTHSQVAKRYAEALFTSLDAADHRLMSQEFETVITVLEDPVIQGVFRHPQTTKERKRALIGKMQLSPTLEKFLLLIVEKSREALLPSMEHHFRQLVLETEGITIAHVTTAISLSEETLCQLQQRLNTLTGKTVRIQTKVDPRIGGGMIIKVDGKVLDGSISHTLKQLQRSFA